MLARLAILGIAALALAAPAHAAQVGTAVVKGRIVILNDDNTWRYSDAPDARATPPCDRLTGIELCVKQIGWTPIEKSGAFAAVYSDSGRYFLGVIQEPYGAKAGVTPEALQTFIIANAAKITNTTPEQLPILAAAAEVPQVAGARAVAFSAQMSGVSFVYDNVFKVRDADSIQFVFWSVGSELTPEFSARIEQTLGKIKAE